MDEEGGQLNPPGTHTAHSTGHTAQHTEEHTAHSTQHTAQATQHRAHSTAQHRAHSTGHTAQGTQHRAHSTRRIGMHVLFLPFGDDIRTLRYTQPQDAEPEQVSTHSTAHITAQHTA